MQTVSLLLATKNSAERLPFLLDGIRRIVDEIVIGVDDSSTDNTLEVARGLADTCVSAKSAGYVESFLYQLFPLCKGDWILRIDDDEFLSRQWAKECITDLNPKLCKVYMIPRYQLAEFGPKPRHLTKGKTHQIRLFWNHQALEPNPTIHSCGVRFKGGVQYLPDFLSLIHIYLLLASKDERRRKVEHYESLSPGAGHQWFYLYDEEEEKMPMQLLPPFLLPNNLRSYWEHYSLAKGLF